MPLNNMTSNGIDTSDATAIASDIMPGKTAYVNGEKLTGNSQAVLTEDATAMAKKIMPGYTAYVKGEKVTGTATNDATATASKILSGYTAYAKGAKATGNHVCPTLASMTADATATAADILSGKTAYVSGSKISGTHPTGIIINNVSVIKYRDRDYGLDWDEASDNATYSVSNNVVTIQFCNEYGGAVGRLVLTLT